jgi:hypothetical protein
MTTLIYLKELRHKGACWQTQIKADKLFKQLKSLLLDSEFIELSIAHNHYLLGEGPEEFYDKCNKLITKYERPHNGGVF